MRCLSVKQPYAGWIASGRKTYELRSWATRYRGELIICAGSRPAYPLTAPAPLGVTLCVVTLVDIVPFSPDMAEAAMAEWRPGLYAWALANPMILDHRPIKGKLGLFMCDRWVTHCR